MVQVIVTRNIYSFCHPHGVRNLIMSSRKSFYCNGRISEFSDESSIRKTKQAEVVQNLAAAQYFILNFNIVGQFCSTKNILILIQNSCQQMSRTVISTNYTTKS